MVVFSLPSMTVDGLYGMNLLEKRILKVYDECNYIDERGRRRRRVC